LARTAPRGSKVNDNKVWAGSKKFIKLFRGLDIADLQILWTQNMKKDLFICGLNQEYGEVGGVACEQQAKLKVLKQKFCC
jgi:hypothetical protein